MTATANPILLAAFEKLVELLQAEGHLVKERGVEMMGYPNEVIYMARPAFHFYLRNYPEFYYSITLHGSHVLVMDVGCDDEGKEWKITADRLVERIDAWLDKVHARNYC